LEAGGFFPNPTKATGTVVLSDVTTSTVTRHQISTDKKNFFYHVALWQDMNGDGKLDVVAARAEEPLIPISKPKGELIWLEQPAVGDPFKEAWTEHVLTPGPDVSFILADLPGGSGSVGPVVLAGEFFDAKGLYLYWCDEVSWAVCNITNIKSKVIDDSIGGIFSLEYADVNGDGVKEVRCPFSNRMHPLEGCCWDSRLYWVEARSYIRVIQYHASQVFTCLPTAP
jgi:hypothetical protein